MAVLRSRDYWRLREEQARQKVIEDEYIRSLEVNRIYAQMQDECEKQIAAFYQKYATAEGITMAEAQARVAAVDIEAYERKAQYYVANRRKRNIAFSDQANKEMRLYNTTMKINRLELLKSQLGLELVNGFDELELYMDEQLTQAAVNEYARMSGILSETVSEQQAQNAQVLPDASYQYQAFDASEILGAEFKNYGTFSSNIWKHQAELKTALDTKLARAIVNGESSASLAAELTHQFKVSRGQAMRLMVTETARVRTDVQKLCYEQNGVKMYEFMALGANPCSEYCADLDGKKFPVSEMRAGDNAPPMHPWCHCATGEVSNDTNYDAWIAGLRAQQGETEE